MATTKVNSAQSLTECATKNGDVDAERFFRCVVNNINGVSPAYDGMPLGNECRHVLLACMPKSGSTYLIRLLENVLRYAHVPLCFEFGRSEQDLYLPNLLYFDHVDTVSQHHLRATEANIALIKAFDIAAG